MTTATEDDMNPAGKNSQTIKTLVTTVLFLVAIGLILAFEFEKIKTFISHAGVWGIFIAILVYGLLGFTIIPSEPLTLLLGAMFGPWVAMIAALVGNTLSATAEYLTGRRISSGTDFLEKTKKLPFGLNKLRPDSAVFLILARAIPGYGGKAVGVLAGIYKVKFWRFLWTAVVTLAVGSAIFAFGGSGLEKLF